jgi:DNA replication protein DnaC
MIFDFQGDRRFCLEKASFVDARKNLVLHDNAGSVEMHFAIAMGTDACGRGTVRFFRSVALVNRLGEAQRQGATSFFEHLAKTDLLICDTLGHVFLEQGGHNSCFGL